MVILIYVKHLVYVCAQSCMQFGLLNAMAPNCRPTSRTHLAMAGDEVAPAVAGAGAGAVAGPA